MVVDIRLKKIDPNQLYLDRVPKETAAAFLKCTELSLFQQKGWYLAGGTALALQAGHRVSLDLDFFTIEKDFLVEDVSENLGQSDAWQPTLQRKGTLYGTFNKAKMSLIAYPFFQPSGDFLRCGTIRILKPHDIAAMKIVAISQRGRKRDFVDLYWYLNFYEPARERGMHPLQDTLDRVLEQYPSQKDNLPHFLKSLTYFDDAENDPMPTCHFPITWPKIKTYFRHEAEKACREIFGIDKI